MGAAVDNLYVKSLLFEILDSSSRIVESFALIVPPSSMTIEFGQRINRVKTFGGVFIDDYGEDNPTIVITGDTGGTNVRSTVTQEGTKTMDGLEAFYYLRDRIMRYKSRKQYASNYASFTVRMYDLGTVRSGDDIPANTSALKLRAEAYEISLDPFRQKRDAGRPLWYSYEIRAFVLRQLGNYQPLPRPVDTSVNSITLVQKIRGTLNDIRNFFSSIQNIFDKINEVVDFADQMLDQLYSFEDSISGALRSASGAIAGVTNLGVRIATYPSELAKAALVTVNEVGQLIETAKSGFTDREASYVLDSYLSVMDQWNTVADTWAYLASIGKSPEKSTTYRIGLSQEGSSVQSYDASTALAASELERLQLPGVTLKRGEVVIQGQFTPVPVTGGDTFETLAARYLGSPDLGYVLAVINNVNDIDEVPAGSTINVPSASLSNVSGNQIYATAGTSYNILGRDVQLSSTGKVSANTSGDFNVIEGEPNLIQALNLRLNTELGTRLRLTLYGLKASIGKPQARVFGNSYIVSNLTDTLLQDPRVLTLADLSFLGDSDKLRISFAAKTLGTESFRFTGGV